MKNFHIPGFLVSELFFADQMIIKPSHDNGFITNIEQKRIPNENLISKLKY